MSWCSKKPVSPRVQIATGEDMDNRVEVVVQKDATRHAIEKAEQANQTLNELLIENGFTLKIYLAAGGKHRKKSS